MEDAQLDIIKTYRKLGGKWEITTKTKVIGYNELPPELAGRTKLNKEVDFSNELEHQLELLN